MHIGFYRCLVCKKEDPEGVPFDGMSYRWCKGRFTAIQFIIELVDICVRHG